MQINPQQERELMLDLWAPALAEDWLKLVLYLYPWNQPGTPLEGITGPRKWQADYLDEMSQNIADNKNRMEMGLLPIVTRNSTVSGRGPGKSALVSWLVHIAMTCQIGGSTIVTANTESQLKTKTWAEVGKWHTLAINSHWFERAALSYKPAAWFDAAVKKDLKIDTGYYYAQAQLWSEENPDGFAGAHNPLGMQVIYDEASGIHEKIFGVTEGFFTEPVLHRYWHLFSNGRRPSGAFFESHHKFRKAWRRRQIDSRTVEGTDPAVYQHIIDKHGIDSDEARVEVLGQFPKQGQRQFIGRQAVVDAMNRELVPDPYAPLIMGVDIARFGDDSSVIRWRQGRDARSIPPVDWKGADSVLSENTIAEWIDKTNPDGVCIDAGNTGSAICDGLKARGYKVTEVWFGAASPDEAWGNFGTYIWAEMRAWLPGGCLATSEDLLVEMPAREYGFVGRSSKVQLEPKEMMKDRGSPSPDDTDALACTFAKKFARKDYGVSRGRNKGKPVAGLDYDPFNPDA
jgi:hypothetical protein